MKFATAASAFALAATVTSLDFEVTSSPLDLKLEAQGHNVKATLTNRGNNDLKVLKTGTILDSAPVEKISIFSQGEKVAFKGIYLRVATHALPEQAFEIIPAGKSISREINAARVHDLSAGGTFQFQSSGFLPIAQLNETNISDSVPYSSNMVTTEVDGKSAAASYVKLDKRFTVSQCRGQYLKYTVNAVNNCATIANYAIEAAAQDRRRIVDYFKTPAAQEIVINVFRRVANMCSTTNSGLPYYCVDVLRACEPGVLAYTLPCKSFMVNCPAFFEDLDPINRECHGQDQATTILHEATHLREVKGTDDYGVYGYAAVKRLSAQQNINHADTYSLFAQSLYADNCNPR